MIVKYKEKDDFEMPISIDEVTFKLSQEGNTDGTTEEYEHLDVTFQSGLYSVGEEHYIVLRTDTGWSIDSPKELFKILSNLQNAVEKADKNKIIVEDAK